MRGRPSRRRTWRTLTRAVCAAAAAGPAAIAAPVAIAASPPRAYDLTVSGTRRGRDGLERYTAHVRYRLAQRQPAIVGYFAERGAVEWTISQGGACPWSKHFRFRTSAGGAAWNGLTFDERGYGVGLGLEVDSVPVLARVNVGADGVVRCIDQRTRVSPHGDWLSGGGPGKLGEPLRGIDTKDGQRLEWNLDPVFSTGGLHARASGSGRATRGETVRIFGGGSFPRGPIASYSWTYTLGAGCQTNQHLTHTYAVGQSVRFVALCTVHSMLTIRDRHGHIATSTTIVAVHPRRGPEWRMQPKLTTETHTYLPEFKPPTSAAGSALILGALRCRDHLGDEAFCREPTRRLGDRYQLTTVSDPGGPFDHWSYVAIPKISLEKILFLNPSLEPDGPSPQPGQPNWYLYNLANGVDVAGQRMQTLAHEGIGSGDPRSGHWQALLDAVTAEGAHNDPRRYLESRIGSNTNNALSVATDRCLDALERDVRSYADDPLIRQELRLPRFFVWSSSYSAPGEWVQKKAGINDETPTVDLPRTRCVDDPRS